MKTEKCNRTIEFDNGLGSSSYNKCHQKPFIKVQYKSSINSQIVTEVLCKTHHNAFIKNINRINSKTGFDFNLTIEALNKQP